MAFGLLDDRFAFHAKVRAAGNEAVGAWVRMLAHVRAQDADGFIDEDMAMTIAKRQGVIDRLLTPPKGFEAGLLERGDGGYLIHGFNDLYGVEAVEAREARREAGRKGGIRSGEARRVKRHEARAKRDLQASGGGGAEDGEASASPLPPPITPPIPVQTNPIHATPGAHAHVGDEAASDGFDVLAFGRLWRVLFVVPPSARPPEDLDELLAEAVSRVVAGAAHRGLSPAVWAEKVLRGFEAMREAWRTEKSVECERSPAKLLAHWTKAEDRADGKTLGGAAARHPSERAEPERPQPPLYKPEPRRRDEMPVEARQEIDKLLGRVKPPPVAEGGTGPAAADPEPST